MKPIETQKTQQDFKLPFKIYRPCNTIWEDNYNIGGVINQNSIVNDTVFFECSQNIDGVNNTQSRMSAEQSQETSIPQVSTHTSNLVKKIFKDVKIDSQLNKH